MGSRKRGNGPSGDVTSAVQAVLVSQKSIEFELTKMQLNQQELMKGHRLTHELLADLQLGLSALENTTGQSLPRVLRRTAGDAMAYSAASLSSFGASIKGQDESKSLPYESQARQESDRDINCHRKAEANENQEAFLPDELLSDDGQQPGDAGPRHRSKSNSMSPTSAPHRPSDPSSEITENAATILQVHAVESPRLLKSDKGKAREIEISYNLDAIGFSKTTTGNSPVQMAKTISANHSLGGRRVSQTDLRRNLTDRTSLTRTSKASRRSHSEPQPKKTRAKMLPNNWPECLTLRDELQELRRSETSDADGDEGVASALFRGSARVSDRHSGWSATGKWQGGGQTKLPLWKHLMMVLTFRLALNPDSRFIIFKELLGFGVLLYDLVITPYIVSWDVEVNGFLLTLSWTAGLYWSCDCLLSFMTGYNKHGELIIRQPESIRHYLKRAFALDGFLLVVDWINIFISSFLTQQVDQGGESILRVGKMSRILKVLRLARLVQLVEKMSMYNLPQSTIHHLNLVLNMVKVTFFLLLCNHILSCFWYMVGLGGLADTNETWLDLAYDQRGEKFREVSAAYQYLTALHWNIAQMTLGSSDVVPRNSVERIFNISLLVMGLLIGSTVVSLFSAQIVQFIIDKHDEAMLIETLQRFLAQNAVPPNLRVRVLSQVDERLKEQGQLAEEDVPALQMLSATLRTELMFEMRMPHLSVHPVFQMWADIDTDALRRLCDSAVSFCFLSSNDDLFLSGTPSNEAYFLVRGSLFYSQLPSGSMVSEMTAKSLMEPTWFCEAALWSNWIHVGDMRAKKVSNLVEVSATGLYAVIGHHEAVRSLTKQYGRNYHVRVVSAVPPHARYPDDIEVPFTDASDLLSHHVGLGLLKKAERQKTVVLSSEVRQNLIKEIKTEKCAVQRRKGGSGLERIVAVATVRISSSEGRFYYQIAKFEEQKGVKFSCQLPGTKRARGELPQAALDRIMRDDLQAFEGLLQWSRTDHEVETSMSEQYMMHTTYMRTIHQAVLHGPERLTRLPTCGNRKSQEELEQYPYPVNHIACREVYAFCQKNSSGKAVLFCWLHPLEVEALKTPAAEVTGAMTEWLESLNVKEVISREDSVSNNLGTSNGFASQAQEEALPPQSSQVVFDDTEEASVTALKMSHLYIEEEVPGPGYELQLLL